MRWHRWAAGFFILQGMAAFSILDRLLYGEWLGKPGDKLTQALNLLLIAASLGLFARGLRRIGGVRSGALAGIGVAGLLLGSAAWSIDPASSLREAVFYLCVVLGSIGIAVNFDAAWFMATFARISVAAGAVSLGLLVVHPAWVTDQGDFRGIFSQKNVLGEAMTMGALALLHGLRAGRRPRWRGWAGLGVVSLAALISASATSCLAIGAFCGLDAVIALYRRRGGFRMAAIGAMALAVPVFIAAAVAPDLLLELIGKDPTLTGRTEIWAFVIPDIMQRPWLGWGYQAFWSVNNPAAIEIGDALHWFAPQAHNGLLEILLHVGVIGAAAFVWMWGRTVWWGMRCLRRGERALAITTLVSCAGIVLVGISETVLVVPFEASTSVFLVTGLMCERAVRQARARPRRVAAARARLVAEPAGL